MKHETHMKTGDMIRLTVRCSPPIGSTSPARWVKRGEIGLFIKSEREDWERSVNDPIGTGVFGDTKTVLWINDCELVEAS